MNLKIIKNDRNELFKRQEVVAEVDEEKTCSRKDIKKNLAAKLNTSEEKTIIAKISGSFGTKKNIITARIYDDLKDLEINEKKHMKKRNQITKEENKEAKEIPKEENKNEESETKKE
jgi:ribosomal protein S24E